MFLSILLREHPGPILNTVKPHLYGTTSTQVRFFVHVSFLLPLVNAFACHHLLRIFFSTADVEFGRLQARDMLQHLWTGPISNAAVDVVQGSRSVEVRSVGVTKVCDMFSIFSFFFFAEDE